MDLTYVEEDPLVVNRRLVDNFLPKLGQFYVFGFNLCDILKDLRPNVKGLIDMWLTPGFKLELYKHAYPQSLRCLNLPTLRDVYALGCWFMEL